MEIFPYEMFISALWTFLCGAAMGVLYDILRLSRVMLGFHYISSKSAIVKNKFTERFPIKNNIDITNRILFKIILFLEDLLFVLTFAAVFILALFYGNGGIFRVVFLIAILLGFAAYYFSLGRITILFFDVWVIYIRTLICYLVYYLLLPFKYVIGKIKLILKKIFAIFAQRLENIKIKGYNKKERERLISLSEIGMIRTKSKEGKNAGREKNKSWQA